MSYTADDAMLNIFDDIKNGRGLFSVKSELLRYFEHVNNRPDCIGEYEEEINFLKGGLDE